MIRIFVFRDLDKIMEIWLAGNISAHPFVNKEYWIQNFDMVKSVLPNAEAYVYEEGDIVGRRSGQQKQCYCSRSERYAVNELSGWFGNNWPFFSAYAILLV